MVKLKVLCQVCKGDLEDKYGHSARVGKVKFCVSCMVNMLLDSDKEFVFINLRKFGKDITQTVRRAKCLQKKKSRKPRARGSST